MKLIIDIPEEIYQHYKKVWQKRRGSIPESCIAFGTPLPKGHGRLIDADELKKTIQENDVLNMTGFNIRLCDINNTPTIIEADNAESEEKE